jgi:hypothetical protein
MDGPMLDLGGIVSKVLVPNRFFGIEVVNRVVSQFVKELAQQSGLRIEGNMTREEIEHLHQLPVLLINLRQTGIEIVVPGKDIDRIRWHDE